MRFFFIGGIPTAGKTTLANKFLESHGYNVVSIDKWREEKFSKDSDLLKWVNFFFDTDEREYWESTTCEEHWKNMVNQSEALWPKTLEEINKIIKTGHPTVFESVNILPHLAAKDLSFSGVYLIGESLESVFERNKAEPRWGMTEELQKKEAEVFYYCEGAKYKTEAEKFGYKVFSNFSEAQKEIVSLIETL